MKEKKIKLLTYKFYIYMLIGCALFPTKVKTSSTGNVFECNRVTYVDETMNEDPNIRIEGSYKISELHTMYEIINEVKSIDKYSDKWNRSKVSMMNEWIIHNICYDLGIEKESSIDVDFRNSEEKLYTLGLSKN